MALVVKDRVKESASNPGTGTVTLSGAVAGFRSFGDIGSGNTTYYVIFDVANSLFEVGEGTYTDNTGGGGNRELARNEVLQNSSGNTSKINFTGSVEVFVALPASKSVHKNNTDNLELTGDFTITSGSATDQIVMKNTNTGTDAAPDLVLWRDSASPANADSLGRIDFRGEDDGSTARNYTSIESKIVNVAASTPTGAIHFKTLNASTTEADVLVLSGNTSTFSGNVDVSGDVSVTSGTNARLSINDAIGEVGSGNLALQVGNSAQSALKPMGFRAEKFIFATGNIGVGTTTIPAANSAYLTVGTQNYAISHNGFSKNSYFDGSSYKAVTNAAGKLIQMGDDIIFYHSPVVNAGASQTQDTLMTLKGTGNVSIPGGAIAVGQSSFSGGGVLADFHASGSGVGSQLAFANDHNTSKFYVGLEGNTTGNALIYQSKDADINFYTNNNLRMTLDNSGNLILDDGNITLPQTGVLAFNSTSDEYITATAGVLYLGVNNTSHLKIEDAVSTFGQSDADYTVKIGSSGYAGIYVDGDSDIAILNPAYDNVVFGANNSRTYIYYDSLSTLYTDANGIYVRSSTNYSDGTIYLGSNGNAQIYNDDDAEVVIKNGANDRVILGANNSYTYLYHNGNAVARTVNDGFQIFSANDNDDGTLYLGDDGYARVSSDRYSSFHMRDGVNDYVLWKDVNSSTYLYYDNTYKFRTTASGAEVFGQLSMTNDQTIRWGGGSLSYIYAQSAGDMVIGSYDDMYLRSNWIRFFDGSNGHPATNEYARISRTGNWFTGPIGVGGNNSGSMNTNGGSYGTSGQVLTSQGNATAPTWADAGGSEWETVTDVQLTSGNDTYLDITVTRGYYYRIWISDHLVNNNGGARKFEILFHNYTYGWQRNESNGYLACYGYSEWTAVNTSVYYPNAYGQQNSDTSFGSFGWVARGECGTKGSNSADFGYMEWYQGDSQVVHGSSNNYCRFNFNMYNYYVQNYGHTTPAISGTSGSLTDSTFINKIRFRNVWGNGFWGNFRVTRLKVS